MYKNGSSSANYSTRKVDGRKIDKRGGSNKGMADGFFFQRNTRGTMAIRYLRVLQSLYNFITTLVNTFGVTTIL